MGAGKVKSVQLSPGRGKNQVNRTGLDKKKDTSLLVRGKGRNGRQGMEISGMERG